DVGEQAAPPGEPRLIISDRIDPRVKPTLATARVPGPDLDIERFAGAQTFRPELRDARLLFRMDEIEPRAKARAGLSVELQRASIDELHPTVRQQREDEPRNLVEAQCRQLSDVHGATFRPQRLCRTPGIDYPRNLLLVLRGLPDRFGAL